LAAAALWCRWCWLAPWVPPPWDGKEARGARWDELRKLGLDVVAKHPRLHAGRLVSHVGLQTAYPSLSPVAKKLGVIG